MLKLSRMGVVILPPMPAFYNHPQNLEDLITNDDADPRSVRHSSGRDEPLGCVMLSEGPDLIETEPDKNRTSPLVFESRSRGRAPHASISAGETVGNIVLTLAFGGCYINLANSSLDEVHGTNRNFLVLAISFVAQ